MTAASLFELAVQFHRAGQVDRAELLYRGALEQAPGHGDALLLLSVITVQSGRLAEAAATAPLSMRTSASAPLPARDVVFRRRIIDAPLLAPGMNAGPAYADGDRSLAQVSRRSRSKRSPYLGPARRLRGAGDHQPAAAGAMRIL